MSTKKLVALAILATSLMGCTSVERMSDEDLAAGIQVAAKGAAQYGLGYVLNKEPAAAAKVAEAARIAVRVIRENVLPAFAAASSEQVLRKAVETALDELTAKLTPNIVLAIQLALDLVAAQVELPSNPADHLSPRARGALVALFRGLAAGLDDGAALAPVREAPPAKLFWPKP